MLPLLMHLLARDTSGYWQQQVAYRITARLGAEASAELTPEQQAAYRAYFGLDKPLTQQYLEWIGNVLRGDFGQSEVRREPDFRGLVCFRDRLPQARLPDASAVRAGADGAAVRGDIDV